MTPDPLPQPPPGVPRNRHLAREWMTMGLYISISLLAATVSRSGKAGWLRTSMIVAIGLALAVGIALLKNALGGH